MEIGIVGLPGSGKTTIFNAVTRGTAEVAGYAEPQGKPNIGVAKVQDDRLDALAEILKPKRKVPAEVVYVDVPAPPEEAGAARGISGELLNRLQATDALLVTARAFEDPSVPTGHEGVDPFRDVSTVLDDLAIADLEILSRRLTRLVESAKGAKAAERESLNKERVLMTRLKDGLGSGEPIRNQSLSDGDTRQLAGFELLTAKPLIVVFNVGEGQLSDIQPLEVRLESEFDGRGVGATALCGQLEMELGQMDPAEEHEFRESMELGDSGLNRMIRLSQDVLDLITFFTGNANEVRAWTITRGTVVLAAAAKIHTDFERGFIRAETVSFDDLARCGSVAEARRQGVLRQEGKSYVVNEGDVINVLFNV